MPLMVSVSGIRGIVGDGLEPGIVVDFVCAYATWVKRTGNNPIIIIGRDTRVTGKMMTNLVTATLNWMGCDVIDLGIVPTPSVQYAVDDYKADGGIIVTASHNPAEWNALKLLTHTGEFMSSEEGEELLKIKNDGNYRGADWDKIGRSKKIKHYHKKHIKKLLDFDFIDYKAIKKRKPKIVVDAVEGAGSTAVPELLETLGCKVVRLHCNEKGIFPHTPEPLPHHLSDLIETVIAEKADFGIALDPDADRLAIIDENGIALGEEYTITAAMDYYLSKNKGPVVVNLSTTKAVEDIAEKYNVPCYRSKVGEINVVKLMQETNAVIGGEGSGGVILPEAHYGRDALVAALLITSYYCENNDTMSELKSNLPQYEMAKKKIELNNWVPDDIIRKLISDHHADNIDTRDGLKVNFSDRWVHLRKSNTEPIIRIYTEAPTLAEAEDLATDYLEKIQAQLVE